MLPGILNHLGPEGVQHLKKMAMANNIAGSRVLSTLGEEEDSDIPDLVSNFESQLSAGGPSEGAATAPPTEVVD
jgi:hypothetical protein